MGPIGHRGSVPSHRWEYKLDTVGEPVLELVDAPATVVGQSPEEDGSVTTNDKTAGQRVC